MKYIFSSFSRITFLMIIFWSTALQSQIINKTDSNTVAKRDADTLVIDSGTKDSLAIFKTTIADYKFKTQVGEEKIFDTVFTIQKFYDFSQYNNIDNFGKIQFSNIGSGFQDLLFRTNDEANLSVLPTNKSHFILGISDIKYYDVKTPTTAFVYHSGQSNGGVLQSTYTQNVGKTFNFAVEYMGLRSQGFYLRNLAASNNVVFSGHYLSKNKKYEFFAHYLHQNISNEENGGLPTLEYFLSDASEFSTRTNLPVNFEDSDSRFAYRRYYFSHQFKPFNSEKFPFIVRHTITHQANKFYYNVGSADLNFYDDVIEGKSPNSKKFSKNLSNTVSVIFDNSKFTLDAGFRHQMIKMGTNNEILTGNPIQPVEFTENRIGVVGNLGINLFEKFYLKSFLEYSTGSEFGSFLKSTNKASFEPIKDYKVEAKANFQSAAPSFNYIINSSPFARYTTLMQDFSNENILELGGTVGLKFFETKLFVNYYKIDNLAYYDETFLPKQSDESVNLSQIGGEATFKYRKFNLNTNLTFQSVFSGKSVLPLPSFVGRANLFYQTKAFKDAAELQGGVKLYYFSKFASRDYSPILNEFVLPNSAAYSIGGTPIADVYFNLKVKRMFIFLEGQHINSTFMKNKTYTAPYFPYHDFRLNIGIVWYLFH